MILVTGKTLNSWRKTCPTATLSMTTLMCTGWNRTNASMAKGWQLTTWAMVHSHECKKVKCTLVQALRFCTGRTAHKGSSGIALLFHDHSTKRGWGVSVTPQPLFTPGKDPVPIVQEAGWAQGLVWTPTWMAFI